jgi:hypothetical protein
MIRVLIDENLSEYFAEGLNSLQKPLDNKIELISLAKQFKKGVKDEDWIPKWGKQDGIFITQDINIALTRHQSQLLEQYGMGAFFLKAPNNSLYWQRVEIMVRHWMEIADIILTKRKPYNYLITPKKVTKQ